MDSIVFTVVIPAYNRESEISRAINSVLQQSFQNFEIIVVDDGSKDNTPKVVETYTDPRIRLIRQENAGATVARNTGIINAKGTFVSFLDSDDEWLPTMLEKQKMVYDKNSLIGCVYSSVVIMSDIRGKTKPFGRKFGVEGEAYKDVLKQGYLAPTTVLSAKKDLLLRVGLFDVSLPASQDDDICFKLAKNTVIGYIPECLAIMHSGTDNRISKNRMKVALGWWMLWNKYEADVVELCGYSIMAKHYYDCAIHFAEAGSLEYLENAMSKILFSERTFSLIKKKLLYVLVKSSGLKKRVVHKILRII